MAARINLLTKMLVILLVLTVVPLSLVGYLALNDARELGNTASSEAVQMGEQALSNAREMGEFALDDAQNMGGTALNDATQALNNLGAAMIKQEAQLVAKQIEIYLKDHPDMTIADLQADPYFRHIAVQPVGLTGYTAITDYDTLTCRWHSNPAIENLDLSKLATKLPGFWGVMSRTKSGIDNDGFYDWADADGSIRQKYMYIACVNKSVKTADGVGLHVAATTYISEYNQPVIETEKKIETAIETSKSNIEEMIDETERAISESNKKTVATIKQATEGISTQNTIFMITAITILIVLTIAIIFARSITVPVVELTDAANRVIKGDLDAKISVSSNDEIKDLAQAMEALVGAVKFFRKGGRK